jgi:hypothetical protein
MRNVLNKSCRENQNTQYVQYFFSRKPSLLWGNVEKCFRAGQARNDMSHAHYMLGTSGNKCTLRICNTCLFTETVVTRMRFTITSYVRCLLTYSVTLYSIQRSKVCFGDDASVFRSGDADFEFQPEHWLFDWSSLFYTSPSRCMPIECL